MSATGNLMSTKTALPPPGPVARRVLSLAAQSVGVQEQGGNNTGPQVDKYIKAGEGDKDPWCYHFLNYLLCKAWLNEEGSPAPTYQQVDDLYVIGTQLSPDIPTFSAWTPDAKDWAIRNGVWIPAEDGLSGAAMPGDWVCYYFPKLKRIGHIEVLERLSDGSAITIGGNTTREAGLSRETSNGRDGVWRKSRSLSQIGRHRGGFIRIAG